MTNTGYKWILCLLLMSQVKHGRWFRMLISPVSIYYGKMDASSSIEQPRANCLQMARFLAWGYFYHRIIHHRVQPSFWSRPFSLLSSSSFLPSLLSLPFFFLFLFYFLCSYPREVCKRNRNYDFFLGGIGNKFREINPKMVCEYKVSVGWGNPTCILTGGETSQSVAHWRWGLPGRLLEARLLTFFPVFSKASYFRFYSFNSMGILVFVHIVNISTYLGGEGYHCIQVNWHLVFLFYFLIVR